MLARSKQRYGYGLLTPPHITRSQMPPARIFATQLGQMALTWSMPPALDGATLTITRGYRSPPTGV